MRLLTLLASLSAFGAESGYVDPVRCRACHQSIYDSYAKTGMGRSFGPAGAVPDLADFFHDASARRYSVVNRAGAFFLRRTQPETGTLEKRIDYVLGSGNHSKTFVHRDPQGRLLELPVSWYSERGGYWAMSPGYDRPDHSDFRRELSDSCLFCHNGYPSEANRGSASGVDCQRCHGLGEQHVRRKGPMLNPAKLSRERQMDVCLQCHLESSSRSLPDAIRRFDRGPFTYRPGEPLSDFKLYFQFVHDERSDNERITVNNAGYGLLQSACFQKNSRMTCTTCHDPHAVFRGDDAERRYSAVCRSCHASVHEVSTRGCADCHMPKRRTEDAVHVVMTDHRIQRRPPAGNPLAPVTERHDRVGGRVKLLYPLRLPDAPDFRLYKAMAQVQVSRSLREDTRSLAKVIETARPESAHPYRVLAESWRKAGFPDRAIAPYRRALEEDPADVQTCIALAELLRAREGTELLEACTRTTPDNVALLNALAVLYARQSRFEDASNLLLRALQINADDPTSWLNFGVFLQAKGDRKGAEAAYRQALLFQPDLAKAREYLSGLQEP